MILDRDATDLGEALVDLQIAAVGREECEADRRGVVDLLQRRLGIPTEQTVVCGMALGYPDPYEMVNTFTPERMKVEEFVTFVDELRN